MNKNRKAFLYMIAHSEGTSTSPATRNNGYDVIVTGVDGEPEIFDDYSEHPFATGRHPKVVNNRGLRSSASGRYQFLRRDWYYYKHLLRLKDFGPAAQDTWAIQLIGERGALRDIDEGRFEDAVRKCRNLWASLSGSPYGQRTNSIDALKEVFVKSGGKISL